MSTTRSRIAVLVSTMTYLVYENFTDLGKGVWREDSGFAGNALTHPYADQSLFPEMCSPTSTTTPSTGHTTSMPMDPASAMAHCSSRYSTCAPSSRYRVMGVSRPSRKRICTSSTGSQIWASTSTFPH